MRKLVKVMCDAFEEKTQEVATPNNVIVCWVTFSAAMLRSRLQMGPDGMTSYVRRRGRRCRVPAAAFGETIWSKR